MSVYLKTLCVQEKDLDALNHVNNIRYLEWIQDISREHWESKVDRAVRNKYLWVVRNHNITYHHSALLGDEILLNTYVLEWKGPLSVRFVEIKNNKTNQLLVKATTEWCLLDQKTGKPIRVPQDIQKGFSSK